jgi:hypothetical protein
VSRVPHFCKTGAVHQNSTESEFPFLISHSGRSGGSLLRWGQAYVDEGAEAYEKRYAEQRVQKLKASANDLGYQLTPKTA